MGTDKVGVSMAAAVLSIQGGACEIVEMVCIVWNCGGGCGLANYCGGDR